MDGWQLGITWVLIWRVRRVSKSRNLQLVVVVISGRMSLRFTCNNIEDRLKEKEIEEMPPYKAHVKVSSINNCIL